MLLNSWRDQLSKFMETVADQDGFVSADDAMSRVVPWEQKYNESLFPAYDTNGDGKISFVEFRGSPLGNHTLIWMDQQDRDQDGFLSLEEFHPREGLAFIGVSKVFFDKLDKNHDGRLDTEEFRFQLNISKVPTNLAFNLFDKNRDSVVEPAEFVAESLKSFPANLSEYDKQSLVMKLEEAVRYADRNRDGHLNYDEFRDSQASLGMTKPAERQVDPAVVAKYKPKKEPAKPVDPNRKWYIIGAVNAAMWVLIAIWLLMPKKTTSSPSIAMSSNPPQPEDRAK
ncbi:EF-hand domain-containing protein [Planctomicrobium sp. SH668]|uniref:EF-hand domain-containing protein n=1 Tax=Planctomicrobium sp. SH668 TaxID=3448126 RepID=UPI003F5ADE66